MKEEKNYTLLSCITYFLIWTIRNLTGNLYIGADVEFLQNRMQQIHDCIKDGVLPIFYYNDFNKVGYGSSFYYGGLTLIPFSLVDSEIGIKIITLFIPILFVFCTRFFVRQVTQKNVELITLCICTSEFMMNMIGTTGFYANIYGLALGTLTLGFAIKFFRDDEFGSMTWLVISFWLTLNTHLVTTLIISICLVMIFLYYFDIKKPKDYTIHELLKIKKYILCFLIAIGVSLYNICNMLYHADILTNTAKINYDILKAGVTHDFSLKKFPFGNFAFRYATDTISVGFVSISISTLVLLIISYIKYKDKILKYKTKKKVIIGIIGIIGIICGIDTVWCFFCEHVNIPFQFPVRYVLYIIIYFMVLILRQVDSPKLYKWIKISQVVALVVFLIIVNVMVIKTTDRRPFEAQVCNGEYLDKSFVYDVDEFEKNSKRVIDVDTEKEYPYTLDKNMLNVDLSSNTDTKVIQIPKLYYKGYVALDKETEEKHKISMGYSQFINIDVENFAGELVVYYTHPLWLVVLMLLDNGFIIYLIFDYLMSCRF